MADFWEIAAVVAPLMLGFLALIVTASPVAIVAIHRWSRHVVSYILPQQSRCRRLLWDDIPDGQVLNQLSSLVSKAATTSSNFTARKPYQLLLNRQYIQIDIRTLKGFLILTADPCRACEKRNVENILDIKAFGPILTVNLKAPRLTSGRMPTSLTKFELERLLDGYPPFYRFEFTTTGGHTLPYPIRNTEQMRRGAWILAAGMSTNSGGLPWLYCMGRVNDESQGSYWKATVVKVAFDMIRLVLSQLETWEQDLNPPPHYHRHTIIGCKKTWTDHAIVCYQLIMSPEYSAYPWIVKTQKIEDSQLFEPLVGQCLCTHKCLGNLPHSLTCRRGQYKKKESAKELTSEQCKAALEIFNNYYHSDENLEIIRPVLLQVLQTLILGLAEVERYFTQQGQQIKLPEALKDRRHVYVRIGHEDEE